MIHFLDPLLLRLFRNDIAALNNDAQVRFQAPDDDWRAYVGTVADMALNVYLADLRENRKLRTNERERNVVGNDLYETAAPMRVDCHYMISAWSPVAPSAMLDPTPDEHALLAEATRVLAFNDPLDPVAIYGAATPPAAPPAEIAEERFPVSLLPVEGFIKLGEFWGTMGDKHRWKPCVYAVITVPIKEAPVRMGPLVTTVYAQTQVAGEPDTATTLFQFGGLLRRSAANNAPFVVGAWIELLDQTGQRRQIVRTDAAGRFVFVQVSEGDYTLRASAVGIGVATHPIHVPATGGGYDFHF